MTIVISLINIKVVSSWDDFYYVSPNDYLKKIASYTSVNSDSLFFMPFLGMSCLYGPVSRWDGLIQDL